MKRFTLGVWRFILSTIAIISAMQMRTASWLFNAGYTKPALTYVFVFLAIIFVSAPIMSYGITIRQKDLNKDFLLPNLYTRMKSWQISIPVVLMIVATAIIAEKNTEYIQDVIGRYASEYLSEDNYDECIIYAGLPSPIPYKTAISIQHDILCEISDDNYTDLVKDSKAYTFDYTITLLFTIILWTVSNDYNDYMRLKRKKLKENIV